MSQISQNEIDLIIQALNRERWMKMAVGLSLLLIAAIFLFSIIGRLNFLFSLCGMLLSFAGFYLLLSGILEYDRQKNHVLETVIASSKSVVWIYYLKVEHFPFGIRILQMTTLHFKLNDYDHITLNLSEKKILELLPSLKKSFPHATFGYSKHYEQMYEISPDLLLKQ